MDFSYQEDELVEVLEDITSIDLKQLIVYNDDFNTFEHVISTLIKICKHTTEQAEQCTWLVHHTGKCSVKRGTYTTLKPMQEGISDKGISAEII